MMTNSVSQNIIVGSNIDLLSLNDANYIIGKVKGVRI